MSDSSRENALGPSATARKATACSAERRKRNTVVFFTVLVGWILLDIATKNAFDRYNVGEHIAGPFFGLFQLKLVHNTGMAWGMLSDSTLLLGVMSVVVCLVLTAYFFVVAGEAPVMQSLGMALVVAGGVGNAIDRFSQGYVVDFIDLAFMDFPVFNVADIGVTCGFVLFLAAVVYSWRKEGTDDVGIGLAGNKEQDGGRSTEEGGKPAAETAEGGAGAASGIEENRKPFDNAGADGER